MRYPTGAIQALNRAERKNKALQRHRLKLSLSVIAILVMLAFAVSGCATMSLEELEAEALITGDWSSVEKREASINRRKAEAEMARRLCGEKILVCKMYMGKCTSYSCVNSIRDILIFQ